MSEQEARHIANLIHTFAKFGLLLTIEEAAKLWNSHFRKKWIDSYK